MIGALLELLARHATTMMAAGIFVGLGWPALAAWLAPLLVPSVFAILVLTLLCQDWTAVRGELRRPFRTAIILLWLAVASPVLMLLLTRLVDAPPALATALVLTAGSAPLISTIAFALLLGLDAALAVVLTLTTLLTLPLYLPPLALLLLGLELRIGLGDFMLRLGILVGGALLVALAVRRAVGPARLTAAAQKIDGVTVIFLVLFAIGVMDGMTAAFFERPWMVALYTAAAFGANIGLQLVGAAMFWWLGRRKALTCGLLSGNRNLAVLIAAMAGDAELDVMLFFVVGQLPIYILPAVLHPVYRRLGRRRPA